MKNATLILLSIGIGLFLQSCSNDLSQGQAKSLIVQKFNLPQIETIKLTKKYFISQKGDRGAFGIPKVALITKPYYSNFKRMLNGLQTKGLITVTESKEYKGGIHYVWAVVTLSGKGAEYLVSETQDEFELKSAEMVFGEITGIKTNEQMKVANVEYSLERVNLSPFGKPSGSSTRNYNATFSLYDDGWRIK